jgi:competence protein ComEC
VVTLSAGSQFDFGGTKIQVLSPDAASTNTPHNNDSFVFRITYGARSLLLTGDAERSIEAQLLAEGSLLKADVLKVGHHGSRTSTTPSFLEAVHPALAVISAGAGNVYRHPHPDVVARLQQSGIRVFRTDQTGLVTIRTDGWRLQADTMAWTGELSRRYEAF